MKLNIGCGKQTWSDYYCVDAVRHPKATRAPDLLHTFDFDKSGQLKNPLPLQNSCAYELCNFHFIEHVYAWEAPAVIQEFYRLLAPGGQLIMELPNIALAADNLLKGQPNQMSMWPFYGDPKTKDPFMCHRWGYTPNTITSLLANAGFTKITLLPPKTHGARVNRDMRIEAVKDHK